MDGNLYSTARGEKRREIKQSNFSFYGLGNDGDWKHMLYLASSVRPSPAIGQDWPTGARYSRGLARPPLCSASQSSYCGQAFESVRCLEIFLNRLLKNEKEKGKSQGLSYFWLNISRTTGS